MSFVPLTGTTIAAIRTDSELVIAADSLYRAQGGSYVKFNAVRKIQQIDKMFFACAGLRGMVSEKWLAEGILRIPDGAFDAYRLACDSLSASILDTAERFSMAVLQPLANEIAKITLYGEDGIVLEALFGGIEANVPVLCIRTFYASTSHVGVRTYFDRADCPINQAGGILGTALGWSVVTETFLHKNQSYFATVDPVLAARSLVQMEMDSDGLRSPNDRHVGPPITVLRLTARGVEWIQNEADIPRPRKGARKHRKKKRRR